MTDPPEEPREVAPGSAAEAPRPLDRLARSLERALELEPPERAAFLDRTVGDEPRLRTELEALLAQPDLDSTLLGTGGALGGELVRDLIDRIERDQGPELVGRQIGAIRIDGVLGQGGMGTVYRGFDTRLERGVAVKTVRRLTADSAARFREEARLLSAVEHPSICRVYDLIEAPECDYLVLELIDGRPLSSWSHTGVDLDAKLRAVEDIARTLDAAHQRGIVHRDLKPDNILVTATGTIKILDFGIATLTPRIAAGPGAGIPRASAESTPGTGPIVGTLGYMSPEQARGEPVDAGSDVFALGLILHELLAGRPAYPRDLDFEELLRRVQRGETAPFEGLTPELRALLQALESPFPQRRPRAAEAAALIAELRDAPRRRRRRQAVRGSIAGVATLVLLGTGLVLRERIAGANTAAAVQTLAREAEEIGWRMAYAELGPRRSLGELRSELETDIEALRTRIPSLPPVARPLAEAAVGRAAYALGDLEQAKTHLDAASDAGARDATLRWTRAQLYVQLHSTAREREALLFGRTQAPSPATEALRDTAAALLAEGGADVDPDHVEALLALSQGRVDDGLAAARRLREREPALWQAANIESSLHRTAAHEHEREGRTKEALASYAAARAAATDTVEIARSAPAAWRQLCLVSFEEAIVAFASAGVSDAIAVRSACDAAAEVAPWSVAAKATAAGAAVVEMYQAKDIGTLEASAAAAVLDLGQLVDAHPHDPLPRRFRALVRQTAVERRMEAGVGDAELDALLADTLWLAEAEPGSSVTWLRHCNALSVAAAAAVSRSAPTGEARVEALSAALRRGVDSFPDRAYFRLQQALFAAPVLGNLRLEAGGDCETPFRDTVGFEEEAIQTANAGMLRSVSLGHAGLALCRLRDRRPVDDAAAASLRVARRTVEEAPNLAGSLWGLGWAWMRVADAERAEGRSPTAALQEAEAAYRRAFELEPTRALGWLELADARSAEASWRLDQGEIPDLAPMRADLERARRALGETPATLHTSALIAALEARIAARRGTPAARAAAPARAALERALAAGLGRGGAWRVERELERLGIGD